MLFRKNKVITILIIIIVVIFGIGYKWGLEKYSSVKNTKKEEPENLDKYTIISKVDEVLSSNVKIILKIMVKNNKNEIEVGKLNLGDLQSEISGRLTLKSVEEYYSRMNYKLLSVNENQIVFLKKTIYEPQKYYLGATKDGFVAIFKCDNEGNLVIEDPVEDISNKKVEEFPVNDQKSISSFEFEFNTKEEAAEELSSIVS
jgi:hypothetical protein